MPRMFCVVAIAALVGTSSGCYHHHLRANGERANSSHFRKTLASPSGGRRIDFVVPPPAVPSQIPGALPSSAGCDTNGMNEVGITSYWKYAAGNVFSFGHWSRAKVEWLCAKRPSVIGPTAPQLDTPGGIGAAVTPKTKPGEFTKRTVHAFFWGALQQNLLPPPSAKNKNPANCKSMRLVKLPMNYGYSLITVFSAGLWSPMRVAWQCVEDQSHASKGLTPAVPGIINVMIPRLAAPAFPHSGRSRWGERPFWKEAYDVPR